MIEQTHYSKNECTLMQNTILYLLINQPYFTRLFDQRILHVEGAKMPFYLTPKPKVMKIRQLVCGLVFIKI